MKTILAACLLAGTAASAAAADPPPKQIRVSKEQLRQIEADLLPLNYWSMVPSALMKQCEKTYPDKLLQSRTSFTAWASSQLELMSRVEPSRDLFSAVLARARQQTQADYEAQTKKLFDDKLVQGLFRDFSAAETEEFCTHLDLALSKILPDDFTRDKLLPAVRNLEALRKRLEE